MKAVTIFFHPLLGHVTNQNVRH